VVGEFEEGLGLVRRSSDAVLPTAGYANLDDVDFAVLELRNSTQAELEITGTGTTIWVA
jgi:hypothetical protein